MVLLFGILLFGLLSLQPKSVVSPLSQIGCYSHRDICSFLLFKRDFCSFNELDGMLQEVKNRSFVRWDAAAFQQIFSYHQENLIFVRKCSGIKSIDIP